MMTHNNLVLVFTYFWLKFLAEGTKRIVSSVSMSSLSFSKDSPMDFYTQNTTTVVRIMTLKIRVHKHNRQARCPNNGDGDGKILLSRLKTSCVRQFYCAQALYRTKPSVTQHPQPLLYYLVTGYAWQHFDCLTWNDIGRSILSWNSMCTVWPL